MKVQSDTLTGTKAAINCELRGKYLLLISGYAMLLHHYKTGMLGSNSIYLELEIEELQSAIKELKREFKKLTGEKWS